MALTPLLPSTSKRNPGGKKSGLAQLVAKNSMFRDIFNVETWLLLGACVQSLLLVLLPPLYASLPAAILLLARIVDTVLVTAGVTKNPYLLGSIQQKVSGQLPDVNGEIKGPGQEKVAVLLLGTKSSHPLGIFAPNVKEVGEYFMEMFKELSADKKNNTGFLGTTDFQRKDDNGSRESLSISYWRSLEDVHNYAHGPTHQKAWSWWNKNAKALGHIGIMHEVFEAPAGMWESVYLNFQPTMMGKTTFLKKDGKLQEGQVGNEWITPLVDASRGPLRTSKGRRGQLVKENEMNDTY